MIFLTGADTPFGRLLRTALQRRGCPLAAVSGKQSSEKTGEKFLPLAVRDGDSADMADAVTETLEHFGRIDVLLQVPDVRQPKDGWRDFDFDVEHVFRNAVARPMVAARAILPVFRGQGGGVIGQVIPPQCAGVFPAIAWGPLKTEGAQAPGAFPVRSKMALQVKIHEPGKDGAGAFAERILMETEKAVSVTRPLSRGSISASQYRWILDWNGQPGRAEPVGKS
ncbi:hypothetical protein [Luteolibacter luteus]|uniref:SDR family oxidoreductase n=1 Tax=Luteolibacter luteus TaxID=2728835 RepID=A0A858RMB6_9BACT|nr:hypothetical protein [Luteolibacter luteus]QJE97855.1 hypothetical protein HHL09_19385 [Luteolibacter luteus]